MTIDSQEASCLFKIREEVLNVKQQTEVNSFTIADIQIRLEKSEKSYEWDKKRDALFKVGLVVGIIVLLSAVYWSYEKLSDKMLHLSDEVAAHTEQANKTKGFSCSTIPLDN